MHHNSCQSEPTCLSVLHNRTRDTAARTARLELTCCERRSRALPAYCRPSLRCIIWRHLGHVHVLQLPTLALFVQEAKQTTKTSSCGAEFCGTLALVPARSMSSWLYSCTLLVGRNQGCTSGDFDSFVVQNEALLCRLQLSS